jgi:hypothetical protein
LALWDQVNVGTPAEQQTNLVTTFGETLTFFIVSANEYVLQAQAPDQEPAALAEQATGTKRTHPNPIGCRASRF